MDVNQLTIGLIEVLIVFNIAQAAITFVRTSRRNLQRDASEHAEELATIKRAVEGASAGMADIKKGMERIASNAERLAGLEAKIEAQTQRVAEQQWMIIDAMKAKGCMKNDS